MDRSDSQIFDRLGPDGLSRALEDLLDASDLVRLANGCGIKYPGMRTQTQKRDRLVGDLVSKAESQAAARKSIVRALRKEAQAAAKEWAAQQGEEKARRLGDESFLLEPGNLGLHLFLLAAEPPEPAGLALEPAQGNLLRLAANGSGAAPAAAKSGREENRLKKKIHGLEKKIRHLEGQLLKARESQRGFKQDLIQRKGELAESRMLVERLHSDLAEARAAAKAAGRAGGGAGDKAVADLSRSMRALASEQKKQTHKLDAWLKAMPKSLGKETLAPVAGELKQIGLRVTEARDEARERATEQSRRLDTLHDDLRGVAGKQKKARPARRTRAKGKERRVGVFIDVQNMYYSARQLKGKLDFDALLEAAVQDRRLLGATAYVVVSKETDQSQFIAMLEKRGIEVKRKSLRVRTDGSMKGDWDMELAFDILDAAPRLDVVVLVSGDGDFTSLVQRVKRMGPRVEVIAFPRTTAKSLLQAADSFQPLDRKFMIYNRRAKGDSDKGPKNASSSKPATAGPAGSARDKPKPDDAKDAKDAKEVKETKETRTAKARA